MPPKAQHHRRTLRNITVRDFVKDMALRIDFDADYQRDKIWSKEQQQLLIDSILRNIDIPKIYIVEAKENDQFDYECIDGKQRMTTLIRFLSPDPIDGQPLTVRHYDEEFTFKEFQKHHPTDARSIEDYELSFVIYQPLDDQFVREIFRRLQLGMRLNSGEYLKSLTGSVRDFIYKEIGNQGPFFRYTNLLVKRYARHFTLAQICINSFERAKPDGEFTRARREDIEDFLIANAYLSEKDKNLNRIRTVLGHLDNSFGPTAEIISSGAVAVSAYLFAEELVVNNRTKQLKEFSTFFVALLNEIKQEMQRIRKYESVQNSRVMEHFHKYITQASVESFSIKKRHEFVKEAFEYYLSPKTKGRILGSK